MAPAGGEVVEISPGLVDPAQPVGELEEGAEKGGAIVVHKRDQAGLLHQAAELDQVAGAFTPRPDARAHVGAGLLGLEPMTLGCCQAQPSRRGLKLPAQAHRRRCSSPGQPIFRSRERISPRVRSTS